MIADIERLVCCESPSDDLDAVARSAETVAELGARRLGAEAELIVIDGRTRVRDAFGRIPSGDLFAVANAIAALLNAPVTIEDRNSRLLAFSSLQEEADLSRVQTILGRQVPEQYTRILEDAGSSRRSIAATGPSSWHLCPGRTTRRSRPPSPARRSRCAPGTRSSERSGWSFPSPSARSAARRSTRRPSSSRCTWCGSAPTRTWSGGCGRSC